MTESDRPILKLLKESGVALRSSSIRYNLKTRYEIEIPESTFYRRLKQLRHANLVEKEDDTYYSITNAGERLLDEDLSDEEVAEISERLKEDISDE